MSLPGHPRRPYDVAMLRSTTRQGTDYGAQRDLEGERVINDSESRGPEHRALGNDQESEEARSSSRESKSSDSRCSPKGSSVSGKGIRKENIGGDIKREDVGVIDRTSERESDMDYARFRFVGGLKELVRIAPTTTEAVVAVAKRHTPGPGLDKALLLDITVPKDSVEKVMQIYLSCYGHFLTRDDGER